METENDNRMTLAELESNLADKQASYYHPNPDPFYVRLYKWLMETERTHGITRDSRVEFTADCEFLLVWLQGEPFARSYRITDREVDSLANMGVRRGNMVKTADGLRRAA